MLILFWGAQFYPCGGADDKSAIVKDLDEAVEVLKKADFQFDDNTWAHVASLMNNQLVVVQSWYDGQWTQGSIHDDHDM